VITWRSRSAVIIAGVIKATGYDDLKALRKALHDAYPFGPRKMHPYKIWCDEIKIQRGLKKRKKKGGRKKFEQVECDPNQTSLF